MRTVLVRAMYVMTLGALAIFAPAATAQAATLTAIVGPGFTISMQAPPVPGTYTVTVNDNSDSHNFHLSGSGVDRSSTVGFVGTATWIVTFAAGSYNYFCDPHSDQMSASFAVAAAKSDPADSGAGNVSGEGDAGSSSGSSPESSGTAGTVTGAGDLPRAGQPAVVIIAFIGWLCIAFGVPALLVGRESG